MVLILTGEIDDWGKMTFFEKSETKNQTEEHKKDNKLTNPKKEGMWQMPSYIKTQLNRKTLTSSIKGSLSKMACTFAASKARSSLFNLSENASASPIPMT